MTVEFACAIPRSTTLFTARQVYAMLENQSLWETATRCHELLASGRIPYAVAGGVAVCLHGYQRNTVDLHLLVRKPDFDRIRSAFEKDSYVWHAEVAEFRTPSGIVRSARGQA